MASEELSIKLKETEHILETYKTINKEMTLRNQELRGNVADNQREIVDLRRQLIKERERSASLQALVTGLVQRATTEFDQMQASIGRCANSFNQTITSVYRLSGAQPDQSLAEASSSSMASASALAATPAANGSRQSTKVQPILKTPGGHLVQSVSVSLPRMNLEVSVNGNGDLSALSAVDSSVSSSSSQERRESSLFEHSPRNNRNEETNEGEEEGTERYTPEPEERHNGDLTPIVEETEHEDSVASILEAAGPAIVAPQPHVLQPVANKENSSASVNNESFSHNISIIRASCSTPYFRSDKRNTLKPLRIVLEPLKMEDYSTASAESVAPTTSPESSVASTASVAETSTSSNVATRRKRKITKPTSPIAEKRRSPNKRSTRPRRATSGRPFTEPKLNSKLRRP